MKGVVLLLLCGLVFVHALDLVELGINPSIFFTAPINPRFASYSFEYGGLPGVAGTSPNLRPSFFQLMNNIKEYTGSSPQFRIGGNSADYSWWNPNNLTFPPKVRYNIEPAELQTIHDVITKLDTYATISLNFDRPTNATWAVEYVEAITNLIGWDNIYAVEIGNEVDLFGYNGYRAANYSYAEYQSEFDYYYQAVAPHLPSDKFVQGATFCCIPEFVDNVPAYVSAEASRLRTLSLHNYPLTNCHAPAVDLYQLLEDRSSIKQADPLIPYAEATIAAGVEFWIGEMNSVSCGGAPNVSNVFGAALWAVDIMFNFIHIGVKGVNFHGGDSGWYASFTYNSTETQIPNVRPIYYGQYLFAQTIRSNSSLITSVHRINVTNEMVKVWAVRDNESQDLRVVILHKDITTTESANVTLHFTELSYSNNAEMIRLVAPSPYSQNGIQIGSQTFDNTQTGAPVGEQVIIPIVGSDNVFSVIIPPASGALLTIFANQ